MIQRKQTIFLILAALCGVLTFLFPIETFVQGGREFVFRTYGLFQGEGVPIVDATPKAPFAVLFGFLSAVLFASIFFFKNRKRQLLMVRTANLMIIGLTVYMFMTSNSVRAFLEQGGVLKAHYGVAAFLPLAMIALAFLAERGIRKDEALVRSTERLR